jgi:hypothetical protein
MTHLHHLQDSVLLSQIKHLVQTERDLLVKILHHLREIERRRLFSDLGYKSLFDYAVQELKYSEGQASRRIQAMRLLKELPQVEEKIATGSLNLSNVQQAQSFFRDVQQSEPRRIITAEEKLDVLVKLENKSVRDGQKELLKLEPVRALPKEKERLVTASMTEVKFLMTEELKAKFESVRSLLGVKGAAMNYAQLFAAMANLSVTALEAKRFGKKRSQKKMAKLSDDEIKDGALLSTLNVDEEKDDANDGAENHKEPKIQMAKSFGVDGSSKKEALLASLNVDDAVLQEIAILGDAIEDIENVHQPDKEAPVSTPTVCESPPNSIPSSRYISKSLKHQVWQRDGGKCQQCGSKQNLNYDHVHPVALGGESILDNLRILCWSCNQRASIKHFGIWPRGGEARAS